jgi:hypothetical protein
MWARFCHEVLDWKNPCTRLAPRTVEGILIVRGPLIKALKNFDETHKSVLGEVSVTECQEGRFQLEKVLEGTRGTQIQS